MLPQATAEHYRAQQRLIVATLGLTRREWSKMGPDFDVSWAALGPRIMLLTASAQLGAARSGAAHVPATLEELGTPVDPVAEVVPAAFAGVASDGRPLDSLLYEAVIRAKEAARIDVDIDGFRADVSGGATTKEALAVGGRALDMYVHTQIADAARGAASVSVAVRPDVGYVRVANPPCCSRCAILAGKWFKWNNQFRRHPRCDCSMAACKESAADGIGTSAETLFAGGHVKGLTEAQRQAVAAGADPAKVINADRRVFVNGRFVSKSSGMTTTEAATRGRRRLTPDGVYRVASDREEALRLLRANGYLR